MTVAPPRPTWQAILKRSLPAPVVEPARSLLRTMRNVVVHLHLWRSHDPVPRAVLYCVYRQRNADLVGELVAQATALSWPVRLWALDATASSLQPWTAGQGPGEKFVICNRLLAADSPEPGAWAVIADDDIRFRTGDLGRLLVVAARAGLDMAQPAHHLDSHFSHGINVRRPGSLARLTDFVEIGPLFAISARVRDRVVPFDERQVMGWGLELAWSTLAADRFRLGVVDAVAVEHLNPVGEGYDSAEARRALTAELTGRGLKDLAEVARDHGTWWAGTRKAPWMKGDGGG